MKSKESSTPYGYKNLLVYKKAEDLQRACSTLTSRFPPFSHSTRSKTLLALADQMDRSARSVKQNIVEGWKRNSTKEYYEFLGFSIAANAELEEDCNDILKGIYPELKGIRGVMGEKGEGTEGEEWEIERVEKLPFYPIDSHLPPLIQLKLRCKEMNFLIQKLQQSLHQKMQDGTKGIIGAAWGTGERGKSGEEWLRSAINEAGLVRSADGHLVSKGEERDEGEKREEKGMVRGRALILVAVVIAAALLFSIRPFLVSGVSMEPTLAPDERVWVDTLSWRLLGISRGDVIVFRHPHDASQIEVKRVVGLPRETVLIEEGLLSVEKPDGTKETFSPSTAIGRTHNGSPKKMPLTKLDYFVMGDNRNQSTDSRDFGAVQPVNIIGKVVYN